MRIPLLAVITALAGGPALAAQDVPTGQVPTRIGVVLVDPADNRTLYTNDDDTPTMSVCLGECTDRFTVFAPPRGAVNVGDYTVVTRDDGVRQWAYQGHLLYTFYVDHSRGDTVADGAQGVWHAARP